MHKRDQVRHNRAAQQFELDVDGQVALAHYRHQDDDILVFDHTLVPEPLRGQGLAAKVVEAGLNYARQESLQVIAQCSYVARYIERHPQYRDLLAART